MIVKDIAHQCCLSITNFFSIILISILLAGCAADLQTRVKNGEDIAASNHFEKKLVKGEGFLLTTFQRISNPRDPYVFYLEGDGHITEGRNIISSNPTPNTPVALKLATLDNRPNIVYIAKPCQYTPPELDPKCTQDYWINKRMSNEVVDSINSVINQINNGKPFSLVGFSAGGGLAIMIAARNKNVHDIITVAGNLDHISYSDYHKALYITKSLNAIDYAKQVNHIPQLHLSGGQDKRMPVLIADIYSKASNSTCVKQKTILHATHNTGWYEIWPEIIKMENICN